LELLEKERIKIYKSKRTRQNVEKKLKNNSRARLKIICGGIVEVWKLFEVSYFESDHFRLKRLLDIQQGRLQVDEDKFNDDEEKQQQELMEKT
jgi:hypothetical protein